MPIASPEVYAEMIDRAKTQGFAYPAINCTSSQTINAAIRGFAFSVFAAEVAKSYDVNIALHTDHAPKDAVEAWVKPLLAASTERVKNGGEPYFQSHMWDGSAVPLDENLVLAEELLELSTAAHSILEIEVGVVGGEEDGVENEINDKLYTTVGDGLATARALGTGEKGRYLTALTFGNVHGVYKPGNVKLRPELLGEIQEKVGAEVGKKAPFDLVFHGGSGSSAEEIAEAVRHGVVKMNIDTDTQYAFTRPVVEHMFRNYDGVLKIDGEVGDKKLYDPRSYGKAAEEGMAERIVEACQNLGSAGTSLQK
ncbi:MAG: class II fructose-bisphosphate aldolase [Brevibacterium linens]